MGCEMKPHDLTILLRTKDCGKLIGRCSSCGLEIGDREDKCSRCGTVFDG